MKSFKKRNYTDYIRLNRHLCQACWKCVEACPHGVIGKVELLFHRHARINYADDCRGCLKCVKACPNLAITSLKIESQVY
jgi:Fe-S-cluster-containing hydrogenase component 2